VDAVHAIPKDRFNVSLGVTTPYAELGPGTPSFISTVGSRAGGLLFKTDSLLVQPTASRDPGTSFKKKKIYDRP
jgi:hypothetical protein